MWNVKTSNAELNEIFDLQASKGTLKKFEIVKATIDCIATIGYEKTTYEAIGRKIGTRRAHIAYHFKNKNDIFKYCVRYIVSNYHKVSGQHVAKSNSPKDTLMRYVDGPYVWSQKHPKQLSSMLLFYYLCSVNEDFKVLNDDVKKTGLKKIQEILIEDLQLNITRKQAITLSKSIQNIMSGYHVTAKTSNLATITASRNETKKQVWELV
jgi:AcrR family transcriptional regulator